MVARRPIDVLTGLRNTRASMGDGTLGGRSRIATPWRPVTRGATPTRSDPLAGQVGQTITLTAASAEDEVVTWDTILDLPARGGFSTLTVPVAAIPAATVGYYDVSLRLTPDGGPVTVTLRRDADVVDIFDLDARVPTHVPVGVYLDDQELTVEVAGAASDLRLTFQLVDVPSDFDFVEVVPLPVPSSVWRAWNGNAAVSTFDPAHLSVRTNPATNPGDLIIVVANHGRFINNLVPGVQVDTEPPGSGWTKFLDGWQSTDPKGEDSEGRVHQRYWAWWKVAGPHDSGLYVTMRYVGAGSGFSATNKNLFLVVIPGPSGGVSDFDVDYATLNSPLGTTAEDIEATPSAGPALNVFLGMIAELFISGGGSTNPADYTGPVTEATLAIDGNSSSGAHDYHLQIPDDGVTPVSYIAEDTDNYFRVFGLRTSVVAGPEPEEPIIRTVGDSPHFVLESEDSAGVSLPDQAEVGDLCVVVALHRAADPDDFFITPSGYTRHVRQVNPQAQTAAVQYLEIWSKVLEPSDIGPTVTVNQPSNSWLAMTLIVLRGRDGAPEFEDAASSQHNASSSTFFEASQASATAAGDDRVAVYGFGCVFGFAGDTTSVQTNPEVLTRQPATYARNRFQAGVQPVGAGSTPASGWTHSNSTHDGATVTAVFRPATP